jgi:ABC-2 type transport system permease protein
MRRYLALLAIQTRISASLGMQYRFDFLLKGAMSLFWLAVAMMPLWALFTHRPSMPGWTFEEALVVMGFFVLCKAILDGAVTPSLLTVVEGIRDGRFDFTLLKPADAQFLVSTARFEPWRIIDLLGGCGIFIYAFVKMGRWPGPLTLFLSAGLLAMAVVLLYSLWIMVVSLSFFVVKVDNLGYLMASLFDAARWPVSVFPRALQVVFTFIFPVALMTTYPAELLLGRLEPGTTAFCFLGGALFATAARIVWLRALRVYTSASS